jgi:DNA repair protein REV1
MRKSVSAAANYGIRFTEQKHCEDFLKQLCEEVHSRMLKSKVIGKSVTLKVMVRAANAPVETAKFLGHGFCDNLTKTVNMSTATDSLEQITTEVIKLSQKLNIRPEDWRGIGIQISKLQSTNVVDEKKNDGIQKFFNSKINISDEKPKQSDASPQKKLNRTLGLRRRGRPPNIKLDDQNRKNVNKPISEEDYEVLYIIFLIFHVRRMINHDCIEI